MSFVIIVGVFLKPGNKIIHQSLGRNFHPPPGGVAIGYKFRRDKAICTEFYQVVSVELSLASSYGRISGYTSPQFYYTILSSPHDSSSEISKTLFATGRESLFSASGPFFMGACSFPTHIWEKARPTLPPRGVRFFSGILGSDRLPAIGGRAMTSEQKRMIDSLRSQGLGYKRIAFETGISENTVKS